MYFVYVLRNISGFFHYIGHSKDPKARLKDHNAGKVRATKGHRPFDIIYTEQYTTRSEAQKREYYLKRGEGNIWLRKKLKKLGRW
ncbi:MAG: GIY-YIG nuclease family protein [Candidatus Neomarinimicrobiota bacterium]